MSADHFAISSDIAFTPIVKSIQERKGSRRAYARMEDGGGFQTDITADLAAFIGGCTTAFLATVNAGGQPYMQHRGGPAGFLKVLDRDTIGFVDFSGNRQFITQGNLLENDRAHLFLMDYAHRRRIKIWGRAEIVEGDDALEARLSPAGYRAEAEQVIIFKVLAWDANCPKHIPQLIEIDAVRTALADKDRTIAALEQEVARLSQQLAMATGSGLAQ